PPCRVEGFVSGIGGSRPWPAAVDRLLEWAAKNQNDKNESDTQDDDLPFGDRASRAQTRSHPHASCRRQAVHAMVAAISDNDAGTEKADAGDDPLDDAACVRAGHRVDR